MTKKQINEKRLMDILDELDDYQYKIEDFDITGGESDQDLEDIALSYHIDQMCDNNEERDEQDFFEDHFDGKI